MGFSLEGQSDGGARTMMVLESPDLAALKGEVAWRMVTILEGAAPYFHALKRNNIDCDCIRYDAWLMRSRNLSLPC